MSKYLRKREVAELLQLSERQVDKLRDSGDLPPAIKIGGSIRWNAEELELWLKGRATR